MNLAPNTFTSRGTHIDSFADKAQMLWRGVLGRCPNCGEGHVLHRYLKVVPHCAVCGEALGHLPADDMPPWLTILIVGHLLFGNVWYFERAFTVPMWVEMAGWPLLGLVLTLIILPRSKSFTVALLWMLRRQKA